MQEPSRRDGALLQGAAGRDRPLGRWQIQVLGGEGHELAQCRLRSVRDVVRRARRAVLVRRRPSAAERFLQRAGHRLGVRRAALALEGKPEEPLDCLAPRQRALAHVQLGVQHRRRHQPEGGHRSGERCPALAFGFPHPVQAS